MAYRLYIFSELRGSKFSLVDKMGNSFNNSGMEGLLLFGNGTVCDHGFDFIAADLICQAMGFDSAQNWRNGYFYSINFRYGINLKSVHCDSRHVSIGECQYSVEENYCQHNGDVILACTKHERGNIFTGRAAGTDRIRKYRFLIYHDNQSRDLNNEF